MKQLHTRDEFENVLLLDKAVVFIFFEWSGQAYVSRRTVLDWAGQSKFEISLFELDPEELTSAAEWVRDEVGDRRGYGSLIWLKSGKIAATELYAGKSTISELETKTSELFIKN